MINLYSRLVTDEDHHTEALTDLLERCLYRDRGHSTTNFSDFVLDVLLDNPTDTQQKARFAEELRRVSLDDISIETQHHTRLWGTPDIVIFRGVRPICVVEVKVDSEPAVAQPKKYDTFLTRANNTPEIPTALALLAARPAILAEFGDRDCASFSVKLRSVAYWSKVADWLKDLYHEDSGLDGSLNTLAREFCEFLERDMPTLDDVAAARNYLSHSHEVLTSVVRDIRQAYCFPNGLNAGNIYHKRVGISGSHSPPGDDVHVVYYGLCFKPVDQNDNHLHGFQRYDIDSLDAPKPVEDGFYAYVSVYGLHDECQQIPIYSENGWYRRNARGTLVPAKKPLPIDSTEWHHWNNDDYAGYAKIRPIQDLLDDDGRIGGQLRQWAHGALDDAFELWNALFD